MDFFHAVVFGVKTEVQDYVHSGAWREDFAEEMRRVRALGGDLYQAAMDWLTDNGIPPEGEDGRRRLRGVPEKTAIRP